MLLRTGTLVTVTTAHINMGDHYLPVTHKGMYMQTLKNGLEEILMPGMRFLHVPASWVSIRCFPDNPAYEMARAELFPNLAPGAEFGIGPSVNVSEEVARPFDTAPSGWAA